MWLSLEEGKTDENSEQISIFFCFGSFSIEVPLKIDGTNILQMGMHGVSLCC
jgi:hypothetical protein